MDNIFAMPMPKAIRSSLLYSTWLVSMALLISYSQQLQSSEIQTLLRIQKLLDFPMALAGVSNTTDLCGLPPSPSLTVVCHENTVTELLIVGEKTSPPANAAFSASYQTLSPDFSMILCSSHSLGSIVSELCRYSPWAYGVLFQASWTAYHLWRR